MQSTEHNSAARSGRRAVQASTTLSRKYTKRPQLNTDVAVSIKKSPRVQRFNSVSEIKAVTNTKASVDTPATAHPLQTMANNKMQARMSAMKPQEPPKVSAKELKDRAIKKALASANNLTTEDMSQNMPKKKVKNAMHFGFGRVMLALGCATAAVFAIVYFVNLNMPDISLRVAAMQTGMDPSYPNYVPRNYSISSITSEEGKITMDFVNPSEEKSFSLIEEKSSWDTNALLSNFVKKEYGEQYTIVREQGLTIYISNSDAAWVNGGNVYKIKAESGTLTNKQIRSIAISL